MKKSELRNIIREEMSRLSETYTENDLKFKDGVAIIKNGRRKVAKVVDVKARSDFFKSMGKSYPSNSQFPYNLEIGSGVRQCKNMGEVIKYLNKYS